MSKRDSQPSPPSGAFLSIMELVEQEVAMLRRREQAQEVESRSATGREFRAMRKIDAAGFAEAFPGYTIRTVLKVGDGGGETAADRFRRFLEDFKTANAITITAQDAPAIIPGRRPKPDPEAVAELKIAWEAWRRLDKIRKMRDSALARGSAPTGKAAKHLRPKRGQTSGQ
jgi:hypothetical protein